MTRRMIGQISSRAVCVIATIAIAVWIAFRPAIANYLGFALPTQLGLPCRFGFNGRHYDDNEQCADIPRSSWAIWYDARNHTAPGGYCATVAILRSENDFPLRQIAGISTLVGAAHPVMVPRRVDLHAYTPAVLFIKDGACYRPYALSGGP